MHSVPSSHLNTHEHDRAILARLGNSDESALDEVMDAYMHRLINIAQIITHSPDLAAEAASDAFVLLWEKRLSLDLDTKVFGYLVLATRNRAMDIMRQEQRQTRKAQLFSQSSPENASINEGELALEYTEAEAIVQQVLQRLPSRCREIFLMHRNGGMSHAEIAAALGVAHGTVKNQVSRAVTDIGRALSQWLAGPR